MHLAAGMMASYSGQFNLPPPTWVSTVKLFGSFYLFKTIWVWRYINYNHNSSPIELFNCHTVSCTWQQGWWQTVQGSLTCPPPTWVSTVKLFGSFYLFKTIWMWRYINYNHNSSPIELFNCHTVSCTWQQGWWQTVQGSLTYPHPPGYQPLNYLAHSPFLKLSECEDVSNIIIIQVKFSWFLCRTVSYAWLQGSGASWPGSLSCLTSA